MKRHFRCGGCSDSFSCKEPHLQRRLCLVDHLPVAFMSRNFARNTNGKRKNNTEYISSFSCSNECLFDVDCLSISETPSFLTNFNYGWVCSSVQDGNSAPLTQFLRSDEDSSHRLFLWIQSPRVTDTSEKRVLVQACSNNRTSLHHGELRSF